MTDEVLKGGNSEDNIFGDIGDDFINGGGGNDIVRGGAGNDTVKGGNGDDDVNGGSGDDLVQGGFGNDNVKGGEGNDTVNGGQGDDTMAGGRDADIFVFDGHWGELAGDDIIVDFADGVDQIQLLNTEIATVSEGGAGVVLTFTTGGSLTINGLSLEQLDSGDFVGGNNLFDLPPLLEEVEEIDDFDTIEFDIIIDFETVA